MALKNVPFRSDVLSWDPDSLADYFRKVSLTLWSVLRLVALGGLDGGLEEESGQNMRGAKQSRDRPSPRQPYQLTERGVDERTC